MTPYIKKVNEKRKALLNKLGLPTNSDYCVYLDWYSDDIPEDVTLIDLPGTGADIADNGSQSSHTALVRGILTEADSVWVLCSDNGTVDRDLLIALGDTLGGNSRKSKVCIYNCKNNRPFDSQPVTEFLDKLPSLTGERCYVVDALAGEYKFIQNGINVLNTQTAALMQRLVFHILKKQWKTHLSFVIVMLLNMPTTHLLRQRMTEAKLLQRRTRKINTPLILSLKKH